MTKLILSTGNIVSGGPSIIRKPGTFRSNLELTNALRSSFLAAQEDYAAEHHAGSPSPAFNGNGNGNGTATPNGSASLDNSTRTTNLTSAQRIPPSTWTSLDPHTSALYVPRIHWPEPPHHGLQEEPSQYTITAKLFFLPGAPVPDRARYAREALEHVLRELGAPAVDLLVVSFPGMSFEGDCEWEADRKNASQGSYEEEVASWGGVEELHRMGLAKRLGLAEFGSEKLGRFLRDGKVLVRPVVNQINLKSCCNVPPPLAQLAREEGIELLVHSDCTDILPKGTLRELLGPGLGGAGILAADPETGGGGGGDGEGLRGELTPQWVVKYTAVVRDRGVIENKGYFAGAELVDK